MLESIRYSSQDILTYFSREINGLKDSRPETRVSSLKTLVSEITREPLLKPCKSYLDIIQELLEELSKTLLRLFNDEKEKCREFSIRLLTLYGIYSLVSGCVDIAGTLGYVFPIVVDRLEAYDLEGIQELPEQMRPIPSQKPQVILNPPEKSEEVRVLLSQLVLSILQKTEPHLLTGYLNELTNITRVLVMDPNSSETILIGCNAMTILCTKATDKLLHYSENLGRSLFTALVHKHWKVRKAGLESLKQVMYCGVYKYNHLIIEALIGFRDPNVVPIKEFYEVSTKLNYFAILVNDKSAHVRSVFFSVIADWLTKLPDKYDHESRLIPYILTGLFDPIPEIKEDCFRYIEEIGQIYEVEKEKDIREMRQLGYQEPWTCEGLMSDLPLPDPFVKRPRLGSRLYFRQYIRRYLNAIFHELGDWISTARLYSSNLLLSLIIFTEDYITQNLDKFLVCMYKALVINNSAEILKNLELSVMLVGRFVDANSYVPQVLTAIMGNLQEERDRSYEGALQVTKLLLRGLCEALPPGLGLSRLSKQFGSLITTLEKVIHTLGPSQCYHILDILEFVSVLSNRLEELQDLHEINLYSVNIVRLAILSEAFGNTNVTNKANKVILAVFSIVRDEFTVMKEVLDRLQADNVEKWHAYDENWKEFSVTVKKLFLLNVIDETLIDLCITIMNRVITSSGTTSIHIPCISLCLHPFPTIKILKEIIQPALLMNSFGSKSRCEVYKILSSLKINSLLLIPGLAKSLSFKDQTLIEQTLEELHYQFEYIRITESNIKELDGNNSPICSSLIETLVELLDNPNENIRMLSIKVITDILNNLEIDLPNSFSLDEYRNGKVNLSVYIANEFEIKLIGDVRALAKRLVALIFSEAEGELKESIHACLVKIKQKRSKAIACECFDAKRGGFLKRWEYLDTLLSIPN